MKTKISILFFATAIFVCCKNSSKVTTTTSTTTTKESPSSGSNNPFDPAPVVKGPLKPDSLEGVYAKAKWPGTDLTHLNQGYTIYIASCGKCHGFVEPTVYDEARWTHLVQEMGPRAEVSGEDQKLILHYILAKRELTLNPR